MGFVGRGSRRPRAVTCKCTRTPVVAGGPHSRASDSMVPYEAHHGLEPLQQPSPVLSKVLARSAISISASAQVGLRLRRGHSFQGSPWAPQGQFQPRSPWHKKNNSPWHEQKNSPWHEQKNSPWYWENKSPWH